MNVSLHVSSVSVCLSVFTDSSSHVGFRNQVRIVHLGGFFSPAPGFPSAFFGLIICALHADAMQGIKCL
jgi:hypothetical protein